MCVCIYVCIYVCMYVCMYVYIYIYIYVCVCVCVFILNEHRIKHEKQQNTQIKKIENVSVTPQ